MAKGQKKSNKEIRKPKQKTPKPAGLPLFGKSLSAGGR
jgi:hypothetical protein